MRKDNYAKAMENAEKSIGLANFMIQVLIFAVAIMTGFGVFNYIKTGQVRKKIDEELEKIRKLKEKMNDEFRKEFEKTVNLRCEIESRRAEADTLMTNMNTVFEDVKRIAKDIEKAGREIDDKKRSVDESKTEVSAISYFAEGRSLRRSGKYEEAIDEYRKATELKPDYVHAYNDWGLALGKLGRHDEELEKYKKARDLDPNNGALWFNTACAFSSLNKRKEALENLRKAIELDPVYKEKAKKDEYFKNLWEDEDFKKLVE